ncbi:fungal-specific transcription factor domain-containing protein [Phascolomyces articulosus]|uniref:Fungal-specific transcription factor domain-containing protein n=1 Tax=Phascolomyces articulosus TaxID=60185 RepID=A0AAD5JXB8_9FUNG|nr:fungal-specific transcription factor domain-containing protein [Phascolomyces articulosus]
MDHVEQNAHDDAPEPKRKRLAQACDVCRRKKIKCDGARPTCANCEKLGRQCTYNPNVKKRGPRQGYIEMLEKRLDKMEKMLSRASEGSQSNTNNNNEEPMVGTSSSSNNNTNGNTNATGSVREGNDSDLQHGRSASLASSSSYASPTQTTNPATAQQQQQQQQQVAAASAAAAVAAACANTAVNLDTCIYGKSSQLPCMDIILHLVELYFENIYFYTPIFHRETLMRDIREQRCSEFLILCILAASARFSERPDVREDPPWHSGEKYASKARELLLNAIDTPSLSNVQALILLTLHEYGCARGPRSWMYSGMAIRMAMELGLNKEPDLEENSGKSMSTDRWTEQELQRRVFWAVFSLDKFLSASTGRPGILQEEDCEVLLPSDEDGWTKGHFYTETVNGSRVVVFNVRALRDSNLLGISTSIDPVSPVNDANNNQLQLGSLAQMNYGASLLGRVTAFINRGGRERKMFTAQGPDPEFIKLDQQIDAWYERLPDNLKTKPSHIERYRKENPVDACRNMLIQVMYNTLIILLNRPALALMDTMNSSVVQQNLKDFFNKSAEKCLDAVDKVTEIVSTIKNDTILISPFMTYLTYTVATIVVNNAFFAKAEEAKKARSALTEHFALLQTVRTYWAMADKLYFMIRDLYAMHSNYMRQKQASMKNTQNEHWQQHQQQRMVAAESAVRQQWPAANTTNMSPVAGLQQQQQQPMPQGGGAEQSVPPAFSSFVSATSPMEDMPPFRGMSLADIAQSTSDGASRTNWILGGDNTKNIAASMQALGRFPNQNIFQMNNNNSTPPFSSTDDQPWLYDFSANIASSPTTAPNNNSSTNNNNTRPPA